MDTIAYIRVSTEDQAANGVSLANQRQLILDYCRLRGMPMLPEDIIEDAGKSGGILDGRDGFRHILQVVAARQVTDLVVYSVERLSRNMVTLLNFEHLLNESSVRLHTVEGLVNTGTTDGFLNFAMKALMGEMERRNAKSRTRSAMQHMKKQNKVVGSIPYGYKRDGDSLVEDVEEQKLLVSVRELYSAGRTLAGIAMFLKLSGELNRSGEAFDPTQIRRMLPSYSATRRAKVGLKGQRLCELIEATA